MDRLNIGELQMRDQSVHEISEITKIVGSILSKVRRRINES